MATAPISVPNSQEPVTNANNTFTRAWYRLLTLLAGSVTSSQGAFTLPSGTLVIYAGLVVPTGFLAADGSAVSRITYSTLNGLAIATGYAAPWGPGDGLTTFNLPNPAPVGGYINIIKT